MYGSWTENVVLWRNVLEFIWDIQNVLIIYLGCYVLKNDDKKCNKSSTVNYLGV